MNLLGISGSLRAGSLNGRLLRLAAESLPGGDSFTVWEGLRSLPHFDQDEEASPELAVLGFRAAVAEADAVLIASPEYNGSIPGALKNALDWGSRPQATSAFRGKPVAVIGASPGSFGGVWAQGETRRVLGLMGARVVGAEFSLGKAHERLVEPDDELRTSLLTVIEALGAEVAAGARAAA